MSNDKVIILEGHQYRVLNTGACCDGKTFCHLASTTSGRQQKNGWYPAQICEWVSDEVLMQAA